MAAGAAIVAASTAGVLAVDAHHQQSLVAEKVSSAVPASSTTAAGSAPIVGQVPADSTPGGSGPVTTARPAAPSPGIAGGSTAGTVPRTSGAPISSTMPTSTDSPSISAPGRTSTARPTPAVAVSHQFKDGTYSATGSYNSPGGIEKLGVTVTLAADKVTTSELDLQGGAGLSHSFQSAFASAYSPQVVGKDISSIKLGSVSGSSLTGMGFNAALKQIEAQARVQK